MPDYVHLSPVILTDAMFFSYVENPLYTGTYAQRQSAYLTAEQQMIRELRTPLIPTRITREFPWPGMYANTKVVLPHANIQTIDRVDVLYGGGTGTCGLQDTSGCYRMRGGEFGYIDAYCIGNLAVINCGCRLTDLYSVEITYTAGLATGVSAVDTSLHAALSIVAEQALYELIDPGASPGGPGAPGIESWSSLGYSEKMPQKALRMTSFGMSARANYAARLVRHLRKKRALRFK